MKFPSETWTPCKGDIVRPGGHFFNRIDTRLARESRREVWQFLAPFLKPERPVS